MKLNNFLLLIHFLLKLRIVIYFIFATYIYICWILGTCCSYCWTWFIFCSIHFTPEVLRYLSRQLGTAYYRGFFRIFLCLGVISIICKRYEYQMVTVLAHASSLRMPREKNVWLTPSMNLSSIITPGSAKFSSTNQRPGLGLIWELLNVSIPMRGQGFSIF